MSRPADSTGINALILKIMGHIVSKTIIGNHADKSNLFAESCKSNCNVGRRTSHIFFKCGAFLQCTVVIYRIEIHRSTTNGNDINRSRWVKRYILFCILFAHYRHLIIIFWIFLGFIYNFHFDYITFFSWVNHLFPLTDNILSKWLILFCISVILVNIN